jgi:acyl-CoA thioester hydrolase
MTASDSRPLQTYCGVVRTWECDENEHLNLAFFVRAFELAAETLATGLLGHNPGGMVARARHMRFHRELLVSQPYEIESAVVRGGIHDGGIVHLLKSGGRICATALDHPDFDTHALPRWNEDEFAPALPRGLSATPHAPNAESRGAAYGMETRLGIVRPGALDHTGALMMYEVFAYGTIASLHLLSGIGLSPEWKKETDCTHMGVEVKITRHGDCNLGDAISSRSWLGPVGHKTLTLRHLISSHTGEPVASVEQVLVVVDYKTRRVVPVPAFVWSVSRA